MLEQARLPAEVVGAAKHGLHLRRQNVQVKWLGDEIVRAHVYGHDNVHIVRRRGDKYYRHAGEAAYLAAPVIAVIKRQADVKQDELRVKFHKLLHDILKIPGDAGLTAP